MTNAFTPSNPLRETMIDISHQGSIGFLKMVGAAFKAAAWAAKEVPTINRRRDEALIRAELAAFREMVRGKQTVTDEDRIRFFDLLDAGAALGKRPRELFVTPRDIDYFKAQPVVLAAQIVDEPLRRIGSGSTATQALPKPRPL